MGLTRDDIALIHKFWHIFEPNAPQYFQDIFTIFLGTHPDSLAKFTQFKGLSYDQLRSSPLVKAHSYRVLATLRSLVQSLDEVELVEGTLFLLADIHLRQHVTVEEFKRFKRVMLAYLCRRLGDILGDELVTAVDKLMSLITAQIDQTMQMALPSLPAITVARQYPADTACKKHRLRGILNYFLRFGKRSSR